MPSEPETTPASAETTERDRQPLDLIDDFPAALVVVEPAAEPARIGCRVEDVALIEPRAHDGDGAGHEREPEKERLIREAVKHQAAATPPAADATSSSMPSRRLMRLRPTCWPRRRSRSR